MTIPYGPGQRPTDPWGPQSPTGQPYAVPTASPGPAQGPPPLGPQQQPPTARPTRERGRPGWAAMGVSTLTAALLASGLTFGAVRALPQGLDQGASPAAITKVVQGDTANPDWTVTAATAAPSVVSIQVTAGQGGAEGSGVVWDTKGRVVTNNHVVASQGQGATIRVTLADGQILDATIVGTDPSTDLAVLQLTDPPKDLKPITVGDVSSVKVGAPVMALGNPLGLSETVTTGIVSALNRPVITKQESSPQQGAPAATGQQADQAVTNAIQTNAAINPGNSGGALVNANGELIGITSSIAALGGGNGESGSIGIGFAIPANEVQTVATQLISGGRATHAWLGVATTDAEATADAGRVIGAGIQNVSVNSPASRAGISTGDVITAVDGKPISGSQALMAMIRSYPVGQRLAVTISRNGVTQEVTVNLGTAPA